MIALPPKQPRKRTETDVVKACLSAIGKIRGARGARNNVGCLEDKRGIPVTYGLGEGSPDIVGFITIGGVNSATPGYRLALVPLRSGESDLDVAPLALTWGLEIKRPKEEGGRNASPNQRTWKRAAERRGVPTGLGRTPVDAVDFVQSVIASLYRTVAQ